MKKKLARTLLFGGKRGPIKITDLYGFDNSKKNGHRGFIVSWCQRGCGFGELTVFSNEKTQRYEAATECMGKKWVTQVLAALTKVLTIVE